MNNNDSPNTTNLDYDAINVNNLDPITTAMMNTDTTRLSLNLSLNLNVEGQTTNDSEAGGRFSSILSWPSWLPTPQFSFIVTPTPLNSNGDNDNNNNGGDNNGGRDLLTGDRNMDDMDDFIGNTRMMDEDGLLCAVADGVPRRGRTPLSGQLQTSHEGTIHADWLKRTYRYAAT